MLINYKIKGLLIPRGERAFILLQLSVVWWWKFQVTFQKCKESQSNRKYMTFPSPSWNLMWNSNWHVCSSFNYLVNLDHRIFVQPQKSWGINSSSSISQDTLHLNFHSSILFCELTGNTSDENLRWRQKIAGGAIGIFTRKLIYTHTQTHADIHRLLIKPRKEPQQCG